MSLTPDQHDTLIDRIVELFQSNEASIEFGENPDQWVDEHLPEGTEAADVASCMPEVGERLGGPYQANLGHYTAHSAPVTHSVINEISYTYNTVYQQNAFIYAEEGAQVTNIQGDGNTVTQVDIDDSFNVEVPTTEEPMVDEPVEEPVEAPNDGIAIEDLEPADGEDGYEDGDEDQGYDEAPEQPWTDPLGDTAMDDPAGTDLGYEPDPVEAPEVVEPADTGMDDAAELA
jgi:hypothetical protein